MKKQLTITFLLLQLLLCQKVFGQLDSIFEPGGWRSYILHLPSNYDPANQYPLVVNIHGLNSNAALQESYSQFNSVADTGGFIVVYPNAIAGSWVINGTSDVDFITHLIDTIRSNYSCNSCLFATGMSQGGFLTYKLACSLPQTLNAIAVVSGNISQSLQNNCSISGGLPILHFHGTSDPLVNYNGTVGIPPVPTTINWLVSQNNCSTIPVNTSLPNINVSDSSTVEKHYYGGGVNSSEVTFYEITNGGHTWPGASPIPPFGFTNMDIHASQIIGDFFSQFCQTISTVNKLEKEMPMVYPNPFSDKISIKNPLSSWNYELINESGQNIWKGNTIEEKDFSTFLKGLYFLKISTPTQPHTIRIIKQ